MLTDHQPKTAKEKYTNMLKTMAMLSKLSSESDIPFLGYRVTENAFCEAFNAKNLSRSDCSADASKDEIGIGIKTFLNGNGRTWQKIAEFNKDQESYRGKIPEEMIVIVAQLRNERLSATKRIHGLKDLIYHCIVRDTGKLIIYECPMRDIDINSIKVQNNRNNIITFSDGQEDYSFNVSKSTLYKRFYTPENPIKEIAVSIVENPFSIISELLGSKSHSLKFSEIKNKNHIFLPLFSDKGGRNVPEKSGLNQWNAGGRRRDYNEIYIPIPLWIHKKFPGFFPPRETSFELLLPDGKTLSAKICQQNGKALMSNPNKELGNWLLRQVMNLPEGSLLTYEHLKRLGLDSVVVYKETDRNYTIDFTELGSYDSFAEEYQHY